jgi:hypothetical protein
LVDETLSWDIVKTRYIVVKTGAEGDDEAAVEEGGVAKEVVDTTSPVLLHYTSRGSFSRPNPNYIKK